MYFQNFPSSRLCCSLVRFLQLSHRNTHGLEMGSEVKTEASADCSTSVLEDEENCKVKVEVKLEEEIFVEAKNGDSSLISKSMAEEEEKLLNSRIKEEQAEPETVPDDAAHLNESQCTRLDELLTQTQLYSAIMSSSFCHSPYRIFLLIFSGLLLEY